MAKGISIQSPLRRHPVDGFWERTTTSLDTAKADLRNLLLTVPGERLMVPDLGLSPKRELFENIFDKEAYSDKVHAQVSKYMPYIVVNQIIITTMDDDPSMPAYHVYIKLFFHMKDFENLSDFVEHLFSN